MSDNAFDPKPLPEQPEPIVNPQDEPETIPSTAPDEPAPEGGEGDGFDDGGGGGRPPNPPGKP